MSEARGDPDPPRTPALFLGGGPGSRVIWLMLSGTKKACPFIPTNLATESRGFGIQLPGLTPASSVLTL